MRNSIALLVALVCAAGAGFFYFQGMKNATAPEPMFHVLKLKTGVSMNEGETIQRDDLDLVPIPTRFADAYEPFFRADQAGITIEFLETQVAAQHIPAGAFLLYAQFVNNPSTRFDMQIQEGMRALSLPVNSANAVGYFIGPGSIIDVLGVRETYDSETGAAYEPETIFSAVKVLAVGDITNYQEFTENPGRNYSNITIEVSPEQASRFMLAQVELGSSFLVLLRNACDTQGDLADCEEE